MDKLKPVAWVAGKTLPEMKGSVVTDEKWIQAMIRAHHEFTPLYALPEGYAIVPVEKIKEAVFDGFMASGEGYNGERCGRLDSEEQAREIADA